MKMTCDADCTRAGWLEYLVTYGHHDLHVSVAPDVELDSEVLAFCHDEQEMITINGWYAHFEPVKG